MKRQRSGSSSGVIKRRRTLTPTQEAEVQRAITRRLNKLSDYKWAALRAHYDSGITGVSWSGTCDDLLANLNRGDGILNNFEGSVIFPKSLKIRYTWTFADEYDTLRLIVFQWFSSTVPTPSEIIDSGAVNSAFAPIAGWHVESRGIMKVLADRQEIIAKPSGSGTPGVVTGTIHVSGKRIRKLRMGQSAPHVQSGGLYMLCITDSGAMAHPGLFYTSQLCFTDGL